MATITEDGARSVASLSEKAGRQKLRQCLGWEPFDEEGNMKRSIHLDVLYQNLEFAVQTGFTWSQVVCVIRFADQLLGQVKASQNLTDTLAYYKDKSMELCDELGERNFKLYTDFIFSIVLPHFKLYQLVFTTDRKEQTPDLKLHVEPPFAINPLKTAKEYRVWVYDKQIEELKTREEERAAERVKEAQAQKLLLQAGSQDTLQTVDMIEMPMSKESIAGIIQDVMKSYSQLTRENLKTQISETQESLEYKLEVTSVPRPQALGPPPRFPTQKQDVLLPDKSPKPPKSPRPVSRASMVSSRGKKK